ncbi:MAG: hypothetical protein ACYCSQ_05620 [bacterium]
MIFQPSRKELYGLKQSTIPNLADYSPNRIVLAAVLTSDSNKNLNKISLFINNETKPISPIQSYQYSIFINKLKIDNHFTDLKKPLELDIRLSGEGFIAKNKELDIISFGNTPIEAKDSILEDLNYLFCEFLSEKDDNLTKDAINLKKLLSSYV